jgi:hypothetical protein
MFREKQIPSKGLGICCYQLFVHTVHRVYTLEIKATLIPETFHATKVVTDASRSYPLSGLHSDGGP